MKGKSYTFVAILPNSLIGPFPAIAKISGSTTYILLVRKQVFP
jgi:hypothetical protein